MTEWKLPRLISDGMILQQKQKCRIWGRTLPAGLVRVTFLGEVYEALADKEGKWQVCLKELLPGGPYTMHICDNAGNESVIENVLIGDVWFCSGQSNMELPMERVKDAYPEEMGNCDNPFIRTFKITENVNFHGPQEELCSGEWKEAKQATISAFSATAYFFAKSLYEMTHVPVGIMNASLGGACIEAWMGRDMLEGYDEALALADTYDDEKFIERQQQKNIEQSQLWHQKLDTSDIGMKEEWEKEETVWEKNDVLTIPFFFRDTVLKDFIGSVWFKRTFQVPEEMAEKEAHLWLGTIVDSDTAYVNGVEVGHTEYQYPPRKYIIPKGVLKRGENTIVIRVKCERGKGRFTVGKKYAIWNEEGEINLEGAWKYQIGASCEPSPETDFISWKPTGLYHGMTAPCHKYNIAGIIWYQGESNTHVPEPYKDLFTRMVEGYRQKWQNKNMPFYYVQLPNFSIDIFDSDEDETGSGWPALRELQRQALSIPHTGMVTTMDLGEDNDLHPLDKKDIGFRLALLAVADLYHKDIEYSGPVVKNIQIEKLEGDSGRIHIICDHAAGGLYSYHTEKGNEIKDFELVDNSGEVYTAAAWTKDGEIIVECSKVKCLTEIRYCYKNTPAGGLIYNKAGLPMSPFVMEMADFIGEYPNAE